MDRLHAMVADAIKAGSYGIVVTDPSQPDNPIVFANRAFADTTGYSEAECLGRNCRFLQGAETDPAAVRRLSDGLRARIPVREVLRNYRKDGSPFWNEVTISPAFNEAGALLAFVSVQRDISSQVAADRMARAAEARLRDFVELASDWFWERGPDLRFTYVSPALAAAIGRSDADLLGHLEADFDPRAFPDWQALATALRRGLPVHALAYRLRSADGTLVRTRADAKPIRGDDGELLGHRGRFAPSHVGAGPRRDVWRSPGVAVSKTDSPAADLGDSPLSPRDLAVIGRLGGGIAHEFNNLLTILHGNLQLLSLEDSVQAIPDVGELIDCALSASREGACLSRTLAMFAPRKRLSPAPVDVNAVLEDMHAMIRLTLAKAVALDLDLDPGAPQAATDAAHLEAAIINLINNARDAMPDGGRLVLSTRRRTLNRTVARDLAPGRYVAISVADTGVGMSPDVLCRAHRPLFTTKAEGKGAGLGLTMADRLAQASNGRLEIASSPGEGTTVTLVLPEALADQEVG